MKNKIILLSVMLFGATTTMNAQIGIGTAQPHQSAQLDITSSDKGLLIPRIALTSATQQLQTTVANEASLLIYNTATVALEGLTPGYYYWDAAKWNRIVKDDEIPAPVNITANNGLTKTANNIALGGALTGTTTVTTTAANTLAIAGLQQTSTIATDKVVVMDANGVLKIADASDFVKTRNTTVYKAKVGKGNGVLTLNILGGESDINLYPATDVFFNGSSSPMDSNGEFTIQEDGVYAVGFYFRYGEGVQLSALDLANGGFAGVRILNDGVEIDRKNFSGVKIGSLIGLLDLVISSTEINTIYQLNAGDKLSFKITLGGLLNATVLTDNEASLYIYKISDL